MAQAAAAYWVTETQLGCDSRLIAAKSKVTGLRQHEHIGCLESRLRGGVGFEDRVSVSNSHGRSNLLHGFHVGIILALHYCNPLGLC